MSFTLQKLVATLKPAVRLPIAGAAPADACVGGPQWSPAVTYSIGNLVLWGGASYLSLANGNLNNQPPASQWRQRTAPAVLTITSDAIGNTCAGQTASNLPIGFNTANYPCFGSPDFVQPPYYMSSLTITIDNSPGLIGTLVMNFTVAGFGPYQLTFNLSTTNGRPDNIASAMLVFLPAIPVTQSSAIVWSIVSGSLPTGEVPFSHPTGSLAQLNGWGLNLLSLGVNGPGVIGPDIALVVATAPLTIPAAGLPLTLASNAHGTFPTPSTPPAYAPVPAGDNVTLHFSNGQNVTLSDTAPAGTLAFSGTFAASTTPILTFTISTTRTGALGLDVVLAGI